MGVERVARSLRGKSTFLGRAKIFARAPKVFELVQKKFAHLNEKKTHLSPTEKSPFWQEFQRVTCKKPGPNAKIF